MIRGIMDGWCIGGDDAGALGVVVAGCENAGTFLVQSGAGCSIGWEVSGRTSWQRATKDGLDARGGGGRLRPVASAGDPGPRPVGRRRVARDRARLRTGNACRGDGGS